MASATPLGHFLTESDILLLGEFCEKRGPVASELCFPTVGATINGDQVLSDAEKKAVEPVLNAFMMRAMSGDHAYSDKFEAHVNLGSPHGVSGATSATPVPGAGNVSPGQQSPASPSLGGSGTTAPGFHMLHHTPCEVLIDNVAWLNNTILVAFVYLFTLPDVRARGYTRTVCFSYLTSDEHKMLAIVPWLSREFQRAAEQMYGRALDRHKRELAHAIESVDRCMSGSLAASPKVTRRMASGLEGERETLWRRALRVPGLVSTTDPTAIALTASRGKRRGTTALCVIATASPATAPLANTTSTSFPSPSMASFESMGDVPQVAQCETVLSFNNLTINTSFLFSSTASAALNNNSSIAVTSGAFPAEPATFSRTSTTSSTPSGSAATTAVPALSSETPMSSPDRFPSSTVVTTATATSTTSAPMRDEECLELVHHLIEVKGSGVLRDLKELCGSDVYDNVMRRMTLALELFGQSTIWLMEIVTQLMRPLPRLMEEVLTSCFDESENLDSQFFLRIGDFVAVDPLLRIDSQLPLFPDRAQRRTALHDEELFHILRERQPANVVNVAFNALRCCPIIVCGTDKAEIVMAMRIAATFIPGIWQTPQLQTALLGFEGVVVSKPPFRLTMNELMHFTLIGCPTSAVIDPSTKAPIFSDVLVWEVNKPDPKKGYIKDVVHCQRKYATDRRRAPASASAIVAGANAAVGGVAEGVGAALAGGSTGGSFATSGLLTELFELLSVRSPVNSEEDFCLTDYTRLLLKRIFSEYAGMAALAMHVIAAPTPRVLTPSTSTAGSLQPRAAVSTVAQSLPDGTESATSTTAHQPNSTQQQEGQRNHAHVDPAQRSPPLLAVHGNAAAAVTGGTSSEQSNVTATPPRQQPGASQSTSFPLGYTPNTTGSSVGGGPSENPLFTDDRAYQVPPSSTSTSGAQFPALPNRGGTMGSPRGPPPPPFSVQPQLPFTLSESDVRNVLESKLGYPSKLHAGDVSIVANVIRRMILAWRWHEESTSKTPGAGYRLGSFNVFLSATSEQ